MDEPLEEVLGITRRRRHRAPPTQPVGTEGHRITERAWQVLRLHHRHEDLAALLCNELERVAPIAHIAYRQNCVLCTDYHFSAKTGAETLWYVPNEYGGITVMLPTERP